MTGSVVQNGNVELYGTVDTEADKDTANIRANGVSGVFSAKNYLTSIKRASSQPSYTTKPQHNQSKLKSNLSRLAF